MVLAVVLVPVVLVPVVLVVLVLVVLVVLVPVQCMVCRRLNHSATHFALTIVKTG